MKRIESKQKKWGNVRVGTSILFGEIKMLWYPNHGEESSSTSLLKSSGLAGRMGIGRIERLVGLAFQTIQDYRVLAAELITGQDFDNL